MHIDGIVWGISLLSLVWIVLIFVWVVGIFRVCLGEKIFLRPKPSLLSCEKILWIDQKERMPYEVTISGGAPWGFRLSGGAPSEEGIRVRYLFIFIRHPRPFWMNNDDTKYTSISVRTVDTTIGLEDDSLGHLYLYHVSVLQSCLSVCLFVFFTWFLQQSNVQHFKKPHK